MKKVLITGLIGMLSILNLINAETFIVNPNNENDGFLPAFYTGMVNFFSHFLFPLIFIFVAIVVVLVLFSLGMIIKKLVNKI